MHVLPKIVDQERTEGNKRMLFPTFYQCWVLYTYKPYQVRKTKKKQKDDTFLHETRSNLVYVQETYVVDYLSYLFGTDDIGFDTQDFRRPEGPADSRTDGCTHSQRWHLRSQNTFTESPKQKHRFVSEESQERLTTS